MFNQFQSATTGININNMAKATAVFKSALLNYQYASNCEWFNDLTNATSIQAVYDVFGIKFIADSVNRVFIPVIENLAPLPNTKDILKAIAPYMENGSIFADDGYRYYTITFTDGEISGKVRDTTKKPQAQPKAQPEKPKKQGKAKKEKEAKKFEFSKPTTAPVTVKRDDNTYTVAELVRELLKQMDAGNGSKLITVEADFLFQNEKYA